MATTEAAASGGQTGQHGQTGQFGQTGQYGQTGQLGTNTLFVRFLGWGILGLMVAFLVNNVLTLRLDAFPGAGFGGGMAIVQAALYPVALIVVAALVARSASRDLRRDSRAMHVFNAWLIRGAFFGVLFVGVADALISFLRVEQTLVDWVGSDLERQLARPQFRGTWVHMPLLAFGFLVAFFTRTLGFTWLALLIVLAELLIVISRFVFSYEQAFMADLVRFWYAALFLFASAHTLFEDGHVRVDVLYAGFGPTTKGMVNAIGSVVLGVTLCWTILVVGMGARTSIINSPLLAFEVTQSGVGMYVKYLMAGFLGLFAISMMIQFCSFLLEAVADWRDEPGRREIGSPVAH